MLSISGEAFRRVNPSHRFVDCSVYDYFVLPDGPAMVRHASRFPVRILARSQTENG